MLSTLHANNSYHALGGFFPSHAGSAPALLADLAAGLKSIISQRLVRAVAGGRIPAVEVMLNTKLVSELIEQGDFSGVKEAMENPWPKARRPSSRTRAPDHRRTTSRATRAWPTPTRRPT